MKEEIKQLYTEHLNNIAEGDDIKRASNGFESAINFMMSEDRTDLLPKFINEIGKSDMFRNEHFTTTFPEFKTLTDRLYGSIYG
jgi:hypothetical protein